MAAPKGNRFGSGGKREGAGRPPDELKKLCAHLIQKNKIIERLSDIAAGLPMIQAIGAFGPLVDKKTKKPIMVPAPLRAQIDAANVLLDRGYGKPAMEIALSGFAGEIDKMRETFK